MFPALWLFFIILNGKWTLEIVLIGIPVAAAGTLFASFLGWDIKKEWSRILRIPMAILFGLRLIWEILKANIDVFKRVYSGREPEPAIVKIPRKFAPEWQTSLLANCITLTPGTITMALADESITVHCLDKTLAEGLQDSAFEKGIEKLGAEKK